MSRYLVFALLSAAAACGSSTPPPATDDRISPVYDRTTGKLTELLSDRDADGRNETRAFMNGAELLRIEIDRTGDNTPDRIEYYLPVSQGGTASAPWMARAEERDGERVVRKEEYVAGRVARVEEDTDGDGKFDKWERYEQGVLASVDLDLEGRGWATRRLVYGPNGTIERIEADPEGDGTFIRVTQTQ